MTKENIEIPLTKVRISESAAKKRAHKAYCKTARDQGAAGAGQMISDVVGPAYYPYYIGHVETSKGRPYLPDKEIMFYIVCDAVDKTYTVLRNLPAVKAIECDRDQVIETFLQEDEFLDRICPESIEARINKQFIFGPPRARTRKCDLIYIPGYDVRIGYESRPEAGFFINGLTGEAKELDI